MEADNADMFEAAPVAEQGIADDGGAMTGTGAGMAAMDATTDAGDGATSGAASGSAWATEALQHLDTAQRAMSSGDWGGLGQAMNTLRSALESAAAGPTVGAAAGAASAASAAMQPTLPAMDSTAMNASEPDSIPAMHTGGIDSGLSASGDWGSPATDNGASAAGVPSYVSATSQPMPEPSDDMGAAGVAAASAGAMASAGAAGAMEPAAMAGAASMDMSEAGETGIARLVVISTGAELSLPEQEEITVGREDPSSGIFPDVDLTPYGGEDGGVSRRHARMLHIGDDYFVEDLQSTNYTKLDGQRLPAHVRERLEDGARLDFGRVAVIFRRS